MLFESCLVPLCLRGEHLVLFTTKSQGHKEVIAEEN
jgi:hypothetical protein